MTYTAFGSNSSANSATPASSIENRTAAANYQATVDSGVLNPRLRPIKGPKSSISTQTDLVRHDKNFFGIVVYSFSIIAFNARADGGCPPGQAPQQGNGWRACVPMGGGASGAPAKRIVYTYVSSYGAISMADDFSYAMRNGYSSSSEAQKAAVAACIAGKGVNCKASGWYRNGCAAIAYGSLGMFAATAETAEAATQKALKSCDKAGGDCKIAKVGCSFP